MPVVVTSSQMLTTGVDVLNVRNIVIVRQINSMTEFKRQLHAEHSDIIDVLAFLQYNSELITYTERVLRAKGDEAFFNRYREQRAKNFLYFILDQYEQHGVQELDTENLSQLIQKSLFRGNRREAVQAFGGKPELIQQAFLDLPVLLFKE